MNRHPRTPSGPRVARFDALAIVDARGDRASPASLLVEFPEAADGSRSAQGLGMARVLAAGTPAEVDSHPAATLAPVTSRPRSILIPGLVNAHTHLDLTHIGPRPHDPDAGFVAWVDMIRAGRNTEDEAIAASVRRGFELALAGGTVAIGDIAGAPRGNPSLVPWRTLASSPLVGVSFLEFFGMGAGRGRVQEHLEATLAGLEPASGAVRLGLQPHATNTVDRRLYEWAVAAAAKNGMPLSTHLAETLEERRFVGSASGPQREFLERLGVWDDSILDHIGRSHHPVRHLEPVLASARFVVAHVNDADDEAIEILARTGTSVAYCPRASAYFGAERTLGPHRYRDMLAAGVNVAIGTDSIVNLPEAASDPARGGISILDEMRLLHQRDGMDPRTLLAMGTTHGAKALGLDPEWFTFRTNGALAGLVEVDAADGPTDFSPLTRILRSASPPALLFGGNLCCLTVKTAAHQRGEV